MAEACTFRVEIAVEIEETKLERLLAERKRGEKKMRRYLKVLKRDEASTLRSSKASFDVRELRETSWSWWSRN